MFPVLFEFGGFTVTTFGLMIALSFLAAGWVTARGLARAGHEPDHAWDLAVWAAVGGILGAKLYYMVLHFNETALDPWTALTSRSGLVWYGGFIGGSLAVLFRLHRLRLPVWPFGDAIAPGLAIGYVLGRIGCFLVGDDYGGPSSAPWAVRFPQGAPPSTAGNLRAFGVDVPAGTPDSAVLAVHPTQLYEAGIMLAIFFVLLRVRPRLAQAPGRLFFLWLALAGAERFFVEFFRAKDDRFLGMFSVAQLISLLLIATAAALAWGMGRGTARTPAAARA
ncbi:MAG TPA: prolipoprotein diacylglyceryl transferase [Longimicrobium sp.]|nr:prolipoprotein diacylglyceryl transferase [Longimicrobium sp.]